MRVKFETITTGEPGWAAAVNQACAELQPSPYSQFLSVASSSSRCSILDHYSFRPDLGHLRFVDLLLYLPGLELGFPALATSF